MAYFSNHIDSYINYHCANCVIIYIDLRNLFGKSNIIMFNNFINIY